MCGISGFFDPRGDLARTDLAPVAGAMAATLHHRGPDDGGTWTDPATGIALGFRRLAIVDLTPTGHQPMRSASGRFTVVFNGEIYNHRDLRRDLAREGMRFRGTSDTETMLEAIEAWGLERALDRMNGMFAIALWDARDRALHLIRDRLGEKPLYYGRFGQSLLFGSELKAFRPHPRFTATIDRDALALFLRFAYVPAPHAIWQGVRKLPPGTRLAIDARHATEPLPEPIAYWSARTVAERGARDLLREAPGALVERLEALLRDATRIRMEADVPLGAFLSGGIDSSTIVALMQKESPRPVRTFTIGFHEDAFNEAVCAKAVAAHLGTDHTELYVSPEEARAVIPRLPAIYDEPFSDVSQLPTRLIAELARREVTVALSGDGGDELFGGYTRYLLSPAIWRWFGWMPRGARRALGRALAYPAPATWDSVFRVFEPFLPRDLRYRRVADKVKKMASVLSTGDPEPLLLELASHWREPALLVPGAVEPLTPLADPRAWPALPGFVERMLYLDSVTYLPDDILVKVDRATMSVGLEARVPFLDHRLFELAWRLPHEVKVRRTETKWILRQLLHRLVPKELVERPKMGFGVPLDAWLRGPLRAWTEDLLDPARLRREGFLDPAPIRARWDEHVTGKRNWHYHLWDVLMFEAWLAEQPGALPAAGLEAAAAQALPGAPALLPPVVPA